MKIRDRAKTRLNVSDLLSLIGELSSTLVALSASNSVADLKLNRLTSRVDPLRVARLAFLSVEQKGQPEFMFGLQLGAD